MHVTPKHWTEFEKRIEVWIHVTPCSLGTIFLVKVFWWSLSVGRKYSSRTLGDRAWCPCTICFIQNFCFCIFSLPSCLVYYWKIFSLQPIPSTADRWHCVTKSSCRCNIPEYLNNEITFCGWISCTEEFVSSLVTPSPLSWNLEPAVELLCSCCTLELVKT